MHSIEVGISTAQLHCICIPHPSTHEGRNSEEKECEVLCTTRPFQLIHHHPINRGLGEDELQPETRIHG